ncbi:MAG: hypothetical protein CR968_02040 [Flavobacteriia bacterium]|nr:MAG: hypothetical protein CR968_02040 [Flavobacteriia bacterium]
MLFAIGLVSCSNDSSEQNNIPINGIEKEFLSQVEFLTENNSMLITPNYHSIEQQIAFTPQGKEISFLTSLGFKIDQSNLFGKSDWTCGLGKMAVAKEVKNITDNGGCALVKKVDDNEYCVKEVLCE